MRLCPCPVCVQCPELSCKLSIGFKQSQRRPQVGPYSALSTKKALAGAGAFSVIVKTDGPFAALVQCVSSIHVLYWLCWWPPGTGHTRGEPPVAGVTEPCCHCGCQESTGGATQTGTLSTLSKHYTIYTIYTLSAIFCKQYQYQ